YQIDPVTCVDDGFDELDRSGGADSESPDYTSESSSVSDSDSDSDSPGSIRNEENRGCKKGKSCPNLHVCKYSWESSCRYGAKCRLKHRRKKSKQRGRRSSRRRSSSSESDSDDGRPYRWQLDFGSGWRNIANDHILEAQYSLPGVKGIRIYNTSHGAIYIDFQHMQVLKKTNIKVRRRGSKHTQWLWHYMNNHGWQQYGEKESKHVNSSTLETEYQKNRLGTYKFSIGANNFVIQFKGLLVNSFLSTGHKRKVRRRPKYVDAKSGGSLNKSMSWLNLSSRAPLWQFKGSGSQWYDFKHRVSTK
uniref:C3H1-type domain-containing protein n=1 Tax=Denticeps clupeoides TaxID=299321 RepID=A0AAY4DRX9_9TELE